MNWTDSKKMFKIIMILEYSPMTQETGVQSQVKSYQRLKKWYLILPCLTLSIIRYGSRVKWSNPEKGVVPFPTHWCSSYLKGKLFRCLLIYSVTLSKILNLTLYLYHRVDCISHFLSFSLLLKPKLGTELITSRW